MLRLGLVSKLVSTNLATRSGPARLGARLMSSKVHETDAEFDARYEAFFNRETNREKYYSTACRFIFECFSKYKPDIDGWEIRKAMGDLAGMDLVPEPTIVAAALRACRRINDYSLTTRILEVVKMKCAYNEKELWPYMMQELRPTLDELGISSLEELGYEKPELMMPNPYEMH